MKNLAICSVPIGPSPVNDVQASDNDLLKDVAGLRKFLFRQAVLLTQDPSAAEDLVQNTFERALAARVTFQPGTNIRAWLSVILRRRFIDDHRQARVRQRISNELKRELEEAVQPELPDARDFLSLDDVVESLGELSARDREVFELFHLRRLSYRQIAVQLGVPAATVGTRIHRSKRRVRALLAPTLATRSAAFRASAGAG